jgi:hypothetical protein
VDSNQGQHRIAHGGKAVYGARLGILMLEARFPRIPGARPPLRFRLTPRGGGGRRAASWSI